MIEIARKNGVVLLDDDDAWLPEQYSIAVGVRRKKNVEPLLVAEVFRRSDQKRGMLARTLLNAPPGLVVDFVNHDTLDCRRKNIRLVTMEQDRANTRAFNEWGYKGVNFANRHRASRWWAIFGLHGVKYRGHIRLTPEQAGLDYNRMMIAAWGRQTVLNEPPCVSLRPVPSPERCVTCNAPCVCCCVCRDEPTPSMVRLFEYLSEGQEAV